MNKPGDDQRASDEPLYNIGAVARMTGIPVATLRIWERRYGFPHSSRTAGGHRLYSQRDVVCLRWVKARNEEGMQTGQAIRALQHLFKQGQFPETFAQTAVLRTEEDPTLKTFQEHLADALLTNNLSQADQVMGQVMAIASLEDVIWRIIAPTFAAIGAAWSDKRISVATEHLATNYLRQRLLMWTLTGPTPYSVPPVVLACAPDEWHEGGLLAMGVLLRSHRWPVAYLGQSVPLPDLADLVRSVRPNLVVVVATVQEAAHALVDWPRWLPEAAETGRPVVGFGGLYFTEHPEWRERVPGRFLGASLQEGLGNIEEILNSTSALYT